jgi:geranylgeranyl diphosphate synthase type II
MTTDPVVDLSGWLLERRREVDAILDARLPARAPGDDPGHLVEAMRYSLLAPGKRLRPMLALAAAEAVAAPEAVTQEPILIAAAAVELVHCYSLIHDDLPAMDDDDLRRGKPSNHKVYGEATAILAGDALLTLAFEWLAEAGEGSGRPRDFGRAVLALARGAGVSGMVRGQARDLGEPAPAALGDLERLHEEKTAALFRAAAEVGAAAAGAHPSLINGLGRFGQRFGIAFQHADDREDGDHDSHAEQARGRVPALLAEAVAALDGTPVAGKDTPLRALASQLAERAAAPTGSQPTRR